MVDKKEIDIILNELKNYEPIFHHPEIFGTSKEDIMAQMSEDFWEVGASGNVYTKEEILEELLSRYNNPEYEDIWEAKDFECRKIADNNYMVTYILIQNKARVTRRCTIWRKENSGWKIFYHQGTVVNEK